MDVSQYINDLYVKDHDNFYQIVSNSLTINHMPNISVSPETGKLFLKVILIVFAFGVGKIRGDIGTAILIIGVGFSLITALISEKGRWKTVSISIVSIVIGVYVFLLLLHSSFFDVTI